MEKSKTFDGVWLAMIGFFVGQCEVMNMNPFAVGYMTAIAALGGNIFFPLIGTSLGMLIKLPIFDTIKYGGIIVGVLLISNMKVFDFIRGKELLVSGLSSMLTLILNLSFYYTVGTVNITKLPIEAAFVFSSGFIFYYALKVMLEDYSRIVVENESLISVLLLGIAVLNGMPLYVFGEIVLLNTVTFFSVVFLFYKFGFNIGVIWTVVAAMIISFKSNQLLYLPACLIIALVSFSLLSLIRGGKVAYVFIFFSVFYVLGVYWYDFLLTEENIKAVISAMFLFLLMPHKIVAHVDGRIKGDELTSNSPEWGRLVIDRINNLASAFKRIEYTLAGSVNTGIGFNDVGEIIEKFTNQLDKQVPLRKTIEANIIEELSGRDIQVKNLVVLKNDDERYEVYITSKTRRGRIVATDVVKKIIEREMKVQLEIKDESRQIVGHNYEVLCFREKPEFVCKTAVRCLSRYDDQVCGDNFYVGEIVDGQYLVMIADGMGNGQRACADSNNVLEIMEELLAAGFDKEVSIKLVNSYLSNLNKGESFATLDMLLVDLHTGMGRMYKQGAATSYIKRGEWLEMIKSTSLPVGVIEGAVCERCIKKFYKNDIIVMVSDGVLESIIFENKDDYLRDILSDMEYDNPEDVVEYILEKVKSIGGSRFKDDATIIVCKLVKTL